MLLPPSPCPGRPEARDTGRWSRPFLLATPGPDGAADGVQRSKPVPQTSGASQRCGAPSCWPSGVGVECPLPPRGPWRSRTPRPGLPVATLLRRLPLSLPPGPRLPQGRSQGRFHLPPPPTPAKHIQKPPTAPEGWGLAPSFFHSLPTSTCGAQAPPPAELSLPHAPHPPHCPEEAQTPLQAGGPHHGHPDQHMDCYGGCWTLPPPWTSQHLCAPLPARFSSDTGVEKPGVEPLEPPPHDCGQGQERG